MRVDQTSVIRMTDWETDAEFKLDGCRTGIDRENLLDLLAVVEDERRFHAAAALLTQDPVECGRFRALATEDSSLVTNVRQGMAQVAQRHLSHRENARQLERYASRLIDRSQRAAPRHVLSTASVQGDSL